MDNALSDVVLAVVSLGLGVRLLGREGGPEIGGVGLVLVGVAAVFGALHFAGASGLQAAHSGVTRLAALVGIPLVGVSYATSAFGRKYAADVRRYSFVLLLVFAVMLIASPLYGRVVGGLGMGLAAVGALAAGRRDPLTALIGITGAAGVMVSGLVIMGEGAWGPLSRVAWFHLALAAACGLLGAGLARFPEPPAASDPEGDDEAATGL